MSNTEVRSPVIECPPTPEHHGAEVESYPPKEVALGAEDALKVRRTLPNMRRSFVGAWCFVDHYGPEEGKCMDVPPHPHTSLQTVSWLFSGEIEHRDSGDVHAMVRPGEVNLMTSGYGISHSEVSTKSRDALHGVQLWTVLPKESADLTREFQHHAPTLDDNHSGVQSRVFIGTLGDASSPIQTETPLLGAELILAPGTTWETDVDPTFEHGVLVDTGYVDFDGTRLDSSVLGVRDPGMGHLRLHNPTDKPARMMLLGGTPFHEGIVMWWNFIGRSHEDIARLREEWNNDPDDRFGRVKGYRGSLDRLPAPEIPTALILKRRFRRGREK